MKYLLDTQIVIWILTEPDKIPAEIKKLITSKDNQLVVSNASLLEITIKQTINKLPEFTATTSEIVEQLQIIDIQLKDISTKYIENYKNIPLLHDHRNPFDRIILATGLAEDIPVISSDAKFQRYSDIITVIWK